MVFKTMIKVRKRGDFIVFAKNIRSQKVNWLKFTVNLTGITNLSFQNEEFPVLTSIN